MNDMAEKRFKNKILIKINFKLNEINASNLNKTLS